VGETPAGWRRCRRGGGGWIPHRCLAMAPTGARVTPVPAPCRTRPDLASPPRPRRAALGQSSRRASSSSALKRSCARKLRWLLEGAVEAAEAGLEWASRREERRQTEQAVVEHAEEATMVGPTGGWDRERPQPPENAARRWPPFKMQLLLR
jgi:hypothetical protein